MIVGSFKEFFSVSELGKSREYRRELKFKMKLEWYLGWVSFVRVSFLLY